MKTRSSLLIGLIAFLVLLAAGVLRADRDKEEQLNPADAEIRIMRRHWSAMAGIYSASILSATRRSGAERCVCMKQSPVRLTAVPGGVYRRAVHSRWGSRWMQMRCLRTW